MTDLYRAWCVAPGENADVVIANLPARSREDFFDYRNGRWLTRAEYCSWLAQQQPVGRRSIDSHRKLYEKNCGALSRRETR